MKKILIALLMMLCLALPALAEDALPQEVHALCEAKYPAYIIAAHDGWGDESRGQYALILTTGESNILCIAEKAEADSAYAFTVENPNALREGAEIPSLLIDTGGDSLYYSYTDGNTKTSYASFKSGGEWQSVCYGLIEEGDTLLQVDVQSEAILMLVRKADGTKRLRISGGWDEYKNGYAVEETGPVPEDASMDTFHMWDGVLFLGNDLCQFNFSLGADGKWHFTSVQSSDSFGILYDGVENWEESSVYRNDHVTYGVSPWNGSITELDLLTLPRSYGEAISQLDTSSYMFVNNPNPDDRLHLRTKPQKGAQSLGKFYNRTPVYVIEENGDWAHVRIGSEENGLEGYMMTKFLTKDAVTCAFPQKHILPDAYDKATCVLTDRPEKNAQEIAVLSEARNWYIIGVANEHWYVIMTGDGTVGYALQGTFYDGNG